MNDFTPGPKSNPLAGFMRQPKIYIRLPSKGAFWPEGSIVIPDNEELAVYSMTAKDELTFKTPDALMNGQGVVDVIQSCIPAIKDAWKTPTLDLDAILIAIRIATYGELMSLSHTVPNTAEEVDYQIDLRVLLDQLVNSSPWNEVVEISKDLTCFVKPLTYKHMTATSLKTFETQKLMQGINDESVPDEQKVELFNRTFKIMTDITTDLVADSVMAIHTPDASVNDPVFIKEFLENADKSIFQKIQDHVAAQRELTKLKPVTITSAPEHVALGAPETYEIPIIIDNADFFGQGS